MSHGKTSVETAIIDIHEYAQLMNIQWLLKIAWKVSGPNRNSSQGYITSDFFVLLSLESFGALWAPTSAKKRTFCCKSPQLVGKILLSALTHPCNAKNSTKISVWVGPNDIMPLAPSDIIWGPRGSLQWVYFTPIQPFWDLSRP